MSNRTLNFVKIQIFHHGWTSLLLSWSTLGIWMSEKNPVVPMPKSKQILTVWACIGRKGKSKMNILNQSVIIYVDILNETTTCQFFISGW